MTAEEFKEFMKDEKNQETFKGIVSALGYKSEEEVKGLIDKKDELLGQLRKVKDERESLKKRLDEIDIDEYIDLKNSKAKTSDKDNDLSRKLEKLNADIEAERKARAEIEAEYNNSLISQALTSEIADKFDPAHRAILTNAFLGKAKIETDNGKKTVVIDDGKYGLPVSEYFKTFAESDAGKPYLIKPVNAGAGAQPLSGAASKTTFKRSEISANEATRKEYAAAMKAGTATLVD